jgi:ankyrin repeat protein
MIMKSMQEFFAAIAAGQKEVAAGLLERDPSLLQCRNEQGDSPLLAAIYAGRRPIFEWLLERGAGVDLFEATALGQAEKVRGLLAENPSLAASYSHDGWTPLHLASFFGHRDIVDLLLTRGAPIDARSKSERFARDNTPLHAAVANNQNHVAELLIERGADVNARDGSGFTPLGLAANSRNDVLVMALLEHGAVIA